MWGPFANSGLDPTVDIQCGILTWQDEWRGDIEDKESIIFAVVFLIVRDGAPLFSHKLIFSSQPFLFLFFLEFSSIIAY